MLLVQGLLLLCSLFAVGTCTCSFTDPEPAETCLQLFEEFESALDTKLNRFNLQKLFSPSLNTVPSLANITYVQYYNMSPEVEHCPTSPDDNSTFINVTTTNTTVLGWSTSGVYDVISPVVLHVYQPQFLRAFMKLIAYINNDRDKIDLNKHNSELESLLWDGTKPLGGVVLNLNLSLQCIPTEDQVASLLVHTTSRLTSYAGASEIGPGYVIRNLESSDNGPANSYLGIIYVMSAFSIIIITLVFPPDEVKKILDKRKGRNYMYIMLIYVIAELLSQLILSIIIWQSKLGYAGVKSYIVIPFIISFIVTPAYTLMVCLFLFMQYKKLIFMQYKIPIFFFCVLNNFVVVILTTAAPFVMLVFIYPIWASSLLLVVMVISVAVYTTNYVVSSVEKKIVVKKHTCVIMWSIKVTIALTVGYILLVYLLVFELLIIYGRGVANGGTFTTILTIIPSLILPSIGWFIKSTRDGDQESKKSGNQQTGDCGSNRQELTPNATEYTPLTEN